MTDMAPKAAAPAVSRFYTLARLVVVLAALGFAVWLLGGVLMVVFAAALLGIVLHNAARLLARAIRLPRGVAMALLLLLAIAALGALGWWAGPSLADQAQALRSSLAAQIGKLHDMLGQSNWGRMALSHLPSSLGGDEKGGGGLPSGLAGSLAGFIGSAFGMLGTLAVVLIAGLYFAISPDIYVNGILRVVQEPHRERARALLQTAGHALWAWAAGQALDMLVVGLLSWLGLMALGVPLAPVLGLLAALLNFVPYIGAIVGAVPAILIALAQGPEQGLLVAGLYALIQGFEGNVMAPLIQRHAVNLPPGLTILSQTVFGAILGLPGLILATPLSAALLAVGEKATAPLEPEERAHIAE